MFYKFLEILQIIANHGLILRRNFRIILSTLVTMSCMRKISPLILVFFAGDLAVALLYLLNWELHQPFHKLNLLLDLDGEASLPARYSSVQMFLVACFLAIFAYTKFDRKNKASWVLSLWPLVFLALSLDEIVQIHEWLGSKSDIFLPGGTRARTIFSTTGIWMFLLGIPFLVFMLGLIYSLKKYLGGKLPVVVKLLAGLLIFVGSATGIETISNFVQPASAGHIIQIFCEELGEMIGGTFFLWAADELLATTGFSLFSE